ncbi:hypothetical protein WN72_15290 [Bradyrhizobium arachidis]|uniref:Uncharacterized protein n=1 Tax=Bradyrhizobium arachidis TaxID=858423 RepID=A0AAE7NWM3_9BRAD|nr:hypothetical protein WN72_15290 [Bradyrhizobium arachidis]
MPGAGTKAGNRADNCPGEGCSVSSVASRDMAAGLSALPPMVVLAQGLARPFGMDQSRRAGRLTTGRLGSGRQRSRAIFAETAVSRQKHTEIMFGGATASCYLRRPMGAEGVVANTSHRPN